ncbi:MAG: nucleotidyltransferase domain-containing protein [Bacteroidota bacterium]
MKSSKKILKKIKQTVQKIEPQSEVILFGSRARGDEKEDSDWDILILIPRQANLKEEQKFRHQLFELELEYGQAISTFVHSKKDWENKYKVTPLYQNIKQEGIRIG